MKPTRLTKVVILMTVLICSHTIARPLYEHGPIEVDNGIAKTKYIIVGFKQRVIDTDVGVALVDTNRYPILDMNLKSLLQRLSIGEQEG